MSLENVRRDAMVEHLILQGAIEINGVDPETGQMLYSITEKLKEVSPNIYADMVDQFEHHMFELIKQGPIVSNWRLKI